MKIIHLALSCSLLLLAGCATTTTADKVDQPVELARLTPKPTKTDSDFTLYGVISEHNGQFTIQTCGGQTPYWLELSAPERQQISQQFNAAVQTIPSSTNDKPISNQSINSQSAKLYAELQGHLDATPKAGLSATYSARFIATQVNQLGSQQNIEPLCAKIPNSMQAARYIGVYISNTDPTGLTIELHLNADHSAQTLYRYSNGQDNLIENGFWQNGQAFNSIKVVMTSHQGDKVVAERIFTQHADTISTQQETINGQIYPLSQHGIVLNKQTKK